VSCIDCHNRGAHHFYSPQHSVDMMLEAGRIDASLPFIKRIAVSALVGEFHNKNAAFAGIEEAISGFYDERYPEIAATRKADIETAVTTVKDVYERSFFPEMKVTWKTYPENIGHMLSAGCLRCHDGLHVNAEGAAISSDCTVCHTFLNPVEGRPGEFREGKFEHSMPLTNHENLRCEQCHSGGPLLTCRDCHTEMRGLDDWHDVGRFHQTTSGD
jgi:hypothetical protein